MAQFMSNLVIASIHGSVVILAVILLRLVLRKTPKKYICLLWLLAGIMLHQFFKESKVAGWLLVPYQLWITFAGVLNFFIARLNP